MSTWQERLKVAIGPRGYSNCMRRSVQSVVLYEAKRCMEPKAATLRPFQRKSAHVDQMIALLESCTFLSPYHKEEIMYRTGSSKEPVDPEVAWKRARSVDTAMANLAKLVTPLITAGKTHNETVDMLVQSFYESSSPPPAKGRPFPMHWEHAHNHNVLAFRIYYRYDQLDPTFPPPVSPREIAIPVTRDRTVPSAYLLKKEARATTVVTTGNKDSDDTSVHGVAMLLEDNTPAPVMANNTVVSEHQKMADRRKILQEVREHLELLKEFEGVVPDEELANRKRELFLALPLAPTTAHINLTTPESNKKFKSSVPTI
jgi:hypothetical protein